MKKIISNAIPFLIVGIAVFLLFTYWNTGDKTDVSEGDQAFISRDFKRAISIYENNRDSLSNKQLMNLADSYLKIGIPERAIAIYENLYQHDEITNEYLGNFYLSLAEWELEGGDHDKAREYFEKAIDNAQSPNLNLKVKHAYGEFISENPTDETIGKGIEYLSEISKLPSESNNYLLLHKLGKLYYLSGQFEQAIATWRKVLSINHQYVPAYESLGILMLDIEVYDEALKVFKEGLNHNQRTWRLYFGMAESYYHLGDKTQAQHYYQETLSFNPTHYPSHYQLAKIYLEKGNNKAASEHLYEVAKNIPDSDLGKKAKEDLEKYLPTFFNKHMLE